MLQYSFNHQKRAPKINQIFQTWAFRRAACVRNQETQNPNMTEAETKHPELKK
jgi:hypothetical protein